jgi:hypothetical protein
MKGMMILGILTMFSTIVTAEEYKMVKKENSILIYERWITRQSNAKVRELKVVFMARSNKDEIVSLLKNEEAGVKWNGRAETYRIVNKEENGYWVNYTRYNTPIGMDDQDWCVQYHYQPEAGNGYTEVLFESIQDSRFPKDKDVKRITGVKGKWILEEQPNGYIKVTYIIATNKDSSIPRWISDPVIHNTIFDTMEEFKKLLETGNY